MYVDYRERENQRYRKRAGTKPSFTDYKSRGLTGHLEHEHEKASLKCIFENRLGPKYLVPGSKLIKKVARL
jgi:hypothetical protein